MDEAQVTGMKIAALVAVTVLYGLLFHGFMRLSLMVFGPFQLDAAAAILWRQIAYVALSALSAAAISSAIWIWRAKTVRAVQAWGVGCLTILLILVNLLISRGPDGLVAAVGAKPFHGALTYLIVFVAVPFCVHVQLHLRRRSATRIPSDAR